MTIIDAKCKFCGAALKLKCDDDYAKLRDPFGLLKFIACNRCAAFHRKRNDLRDALKKLSHFIRFTKDREKFRKEAERLLSSYLQHHAEFHRCEATFDPGCVDSFLSKPEQLALILDHLTELQQTLPVA